jgi:hypothetical protein
MFLCYNCGTDFVDKRCGWVLIETKVIVPQEALIEKDKEKEIENGGRFRGGESGQEPGGQAPELQN